MEKDTKAKNKDSELSLVDISLDNLDLPPIRTLQGDLATLLEKNKITKSDFNKLDKDLRRETEDYQKKGGDKNAAEELKLFVEEIDNEKKSGPDEISKMFRDPHQEFTDNAQKRARINTENLRKNLIYESSPTQNLPKEDFFTKLGAMPEKSVPEEDDLDEALVGLPVGLPEGIIKKLPEPTLETPKKELSLKSKDEVIDKTTIRKLPKIVKKILPPPPPKPSPLIEMEGERVRLEGELRNLPQEEGVIDTSLRHLEDQKERLTNFLSPLIQKEAELEEQILQVEGEEAKNPGLESRKQFEQKRWTLEDQRRGTEEKRWQTDQEIIKLQKEIEGARGRKQTFTNKKVSLELELEKISKKKRAFLAERELSILRSKLKEIDTMKGPVELEWISLNERKQRDAGDLSRLESEEEGIEAKLRDVQMQERASTNAHERHSFEAERWKTETIRREIEKRRWVLEEELGNLISGMRELGIKYKKVLEAEKLIEEKIHELETLQDEVGASLGF